MMELARGGWPKALLAGRVECLQTCYFPAQKQACKDPSCWVTPEFISQLIKEASFSLSFPFLLRISGVVHRQTRPGLVQLSISMEGGKRLEEGKRTPTPPLGRVGLVGPGWVLVCALGTGAAKLAFRTRGSLIPPSHKACSLSPPTTRGSGGQAHVRVWRAVPFYQTPPALGLEPI